MKCPYQTRVIHKPEYTEGYVKNFAENITMFADCLKTECPFYYITEYKPARKKKQSIVVGQKARNSMTKEELTRNLKYTMEKHKNDNVPTFGTNISLMCKDVLDYLEQEPKTGHWVLDGSDNSLECINCGCVLYANDIMRGEPHYCPNCGARMESEG